MKYDCIGHGPQPGDVAHGGTFGVVPITGRSNQPASSNGGVPNIGGGLDDEPAAASFADDGAGSSRTATPVDAAACAGCSGNAATRGDHVSDGYAHQTSDDRGCHSSDGYSSANARPNKRAAATSVIAPMTGKLLRIGWRQNITQ